MSGSRFRPLPLGTVRPAGWLLDQLRVQASGLSGCIEEVWPDLGPASGWLGGDGESWERGPYYLDGLIPLAELLDDAGLRERSRTWIEAVLASQRDDGFFGPRHTKVRWEGDWWYFVPALKALAQHHELTGDERVLQHLSRFFRFQAANLERQPLTGWGQARAGEADLVLQWLHARTHDSFCIEHARRLRAASIDWTSYFLDFPYPRIPEPFTFRFDTHIVNVAMAIKYPALWHAWTPDDRDLRASLQALDVLDRYHGQANGLLAGDEHLSGTDPTRGSELCHVVELMFSLEHLIASTGEARFADRLERVAYNALPATFDRHMNVHQYLQQVNQVACSVARRHWVNNGDRANLFGLEPEFGCCTANYHQGWPKFVAHMMYATSDGGLATGALGPCRVRANVGRSATPITLSVHTTYPFGSRVTFEIEASRPVAFPLHVRVPGTCRAAMLDGQPAEPGRYRVIERTFSPGETITLELDRDVRVTSAPGGMGRTFDYGPLLLALPLAFEERIVGDGDPRFADRALHPEGSWAWTVQTDPACESVQVAVREPSAIPFDELAPPLSIPVRVAPVANWELVNDSAGPVPSNDTSDETAEMPGHLVPFGSTRLRLAVFPPRCVEP